jgi:signal transduction histidine kinase
LSAFVSHTAQGTTIEPVEPDHATSSLAAVTGGSDLTDARLDRLLHAVLAVSDDLDLEAMLGRVVSAACELVEARYGALGVIDEDGDALSAFVHHGVEAATVRRIGDLPEGRGILGLLIDEPAPLRLDDLSSHPLSYGFPPGHPPMHAFLGAPIRVRDQAFGNIYLTEKRDGSSFTDDDEALVVGLAAVAGAAIANARLYDEARRRETWRSAVLEVSETVLSGSPSGVVRQRVAELGCALVDGDAACLIEPHEAGLWVLASVGEGPPIGHLEHTESPAYEALEAGRAVRVGHGPILGRASVWVPVRVDQEVVGAVGVGRDRPFTNRDERLLAEFAAQVSFAWTFEQAQSDLHRLSLIEDRERIGRDLHDTVIQRLFATGLSLQATIRRCDELPEIAQRLERAIDDIDETVKEIRTTIFALQDSAGSTRGVRHRVLEVVDELEHVLPVRPRIQFDGPVDTIVGDEVLAHLAPVVREALTNVAKHAQATEVRLELAVIAGGLRVRVSDDGVGVPRDVVGGFGLKNLQDRAAVFGGELRIETRAEGWGTLLEWSLPPG